MDGAFREAQPTLEAEDGLVHQFCPLNSQRANVEAP